MEKGDDVLGVAEAATLLRAEAETIMQYARSGKLPGTRIGKGWLFLREDVLDFLRRQIHTDTQERLARTTAEGMTAMLLDRPKKTRRRALPDLSIFDERPSE